MLNIFFFLVILSATIFIKIRYRPVGDGANKLFVIALMTAGIMLLTVGSTETLGSLLYYAAEAVIGSAILLIYRFEAHRQLSDRRRKRAEARVSVQSRSEVHSDARQLCAVRRPLSCYAAFIEDCNEAA